MSNQISYVCCWGSESPAAEQAGAHCCRQQAGPGHSTKPTSSMMSTSFNRPAGAHAATTGQPLGTLPSLRAVDAVCTVRCHVPSQRGPAGAMLWELGALSADAQSQ